MSSYAYVDVPNPNLVCCICRAPFVDPCTTRTCYHTFCYECIARAIAISRHCPIDRCPLTLHDLSPADPLIRNLVDEMIVECPQRSEGCSYTCQRLLLPVHLNESCEYTEVTCPEAECGQLVMRRYLSGHVHIHPAEDAETKSDPPRAEVPGTVSSQDNAHTPLLSHLATPPPEISLEAENAILRLRIFALEGVVNVLRQEMQAVQRVLGPWYRSEESGTPMSQEPPARSSANINGLVPHNDEQNADMTPGPGGIEHSPLVQSHSNPVDIPDVRTASSGEAASSIDLASYFPPAEEHDVYSPQFLRSALQAQSWSPPPRQGLSQQVLPMASARSHPAAVLPQPAAFSPSAYTLGPSFVSHPPLPYTSQSSFPQAPPAILVPPLDPTQPLPSTLASLHGTLVSLAGALSALASSRAQDALYTGEEFRSIRAGMHGLRMQLHDLMTPRVATGTVSAPAPPSSTLAAGSSIEGGGIGSGAPTGAPSWLSFGPRMFGPPTFPHLPVSTTKL